MTDIDIWSFSGTQFSYGLWTGDRFIDVELAELPVAHQPLEADRARRAQSH
jgi:hypothetical protein